MPGQGDYTVCASRKGVEAWQVGVDLFPHERRQ
jgi:hypothetical protein